MTLEAKQVQRATGCWSKTGARTGIPGVLPKVKLVLDTLGARAERLITTHFFCKCCPLTILQFQELFCRRGKEMLVWPLASGLGNAALLGGEEFGSEARMSRAVASPDGRVCA